MTDAEGKMRITSCCCCFLNDSQPYGTSKQQVRINIFMVLLICLPVCLHFLSLQRKVNSTGRCASIAMRLSTVELVCPTTSGHMQNGKEWPYLKEPVSVISDSITHHNRHGGVHII